MTSAIVGPMCAYTLFLFGIWALLGYVRISGTLRGMIPAQYLRVGQGPLPPAKIVDVHHHFSNQFEVPVLFYALAAVALATSHVPGWLISGAWLYVALRILHSLIHCTYNRVMHRFAVFLLSFALLVGLCVAFFLTLHSPSAS